MLETEITLTLVGDDWQPKEPNWNHQGFFARLALRKSDGEEVEIVGGDVEEFFQKMLDEVRKDVEYAERNG